MSDRVKEILWSVVVVIAILTISLMLNANKVIEETQQRQISEKVETSQETKEYTTKAKEEYNYISEDEIILNIEAALKQKFDYADIVKDETDNRIIHVKVANYGFTKSTSNMQGIGKQFYEYNDMVIKMKNMCKDYNDIFKDNGLDRDVFVSIMNDENMDNVLLMVSESQVIYSIYE